MMGNGISSITGKASPLNLCRVPVETERTMVKERERRGKVTHEEHLGVSFGEVTTIRFGVVEIDGERRPDNERSPQDHILDLENATRRQTVHNTIVVTRCVKEARQRQKSENGKIKVT